jgi:hypothetical protein
MRNRIINLKETLVELIAILLLNLLNRYRASTLAAQSVRAQVFRALS